MAEIQCQEPNNAEVTEHYQVKISNRFACLENSEETGYTNTTLKKICTELYNLWVIMPKGTTLSKIPKYVRQSHKASFKEMVIKRAEASNCTPARIFQRQRADNRQHYKFCNIKTKQAKPKERHFLPYFSIDNARVIYTKKV